jgi:3-oxoacyl-[acyl-carrier protein] reductase
MNLQDKICIVTGGAKGIGRSIVELFFEEGATVIIWDIDFDAAIDLKNNLENTKKCNNEILVEKVDVTISIEIKNAIDNILNRFGTIDILINNAGIYTISDDFINEDEVEWNRVININLKSVFLCSKIALPIMIKNRYGKIVNISSISGKKESIYASSSYVASKAGVIGLTKCIAARTAKYGINVNCVAPAIIDTTMNVILDNEKKEKAVKTIPLGRMGKPEDIANAVLFLVKDASSFITGETIDVNGGSLMD